MTVRELILELEKCNLDAPVMIFECDYDQIDEVEVTVVKACLGKKTEYQGALKGRYFWITDWHCKDDEGVFDVVTLR